MTTPSLESRIKDTWFGTDLTEPATTQLVDLARHYEAPARTCLLREGDLTSELSVVTSGRVALTERLPGRDPLTLMSVETGDVFGWSALVRPHRAISTVTALESVEVVAFDAPRLRAAMAEDPEMAAQVLGKLLDAVARRLQATRHQLLDLYGTGWTQPIHEPW